MGNAEPRALALPSVILEGLVWRIELKSECRSGGGANLKATADPSPSTDTHSARNFAQKGAMLI